jgi:hypothetical protein
VQPGNLVRITRSGIGRPAGALALIFEAYETLARGGTKVFRVELLGYYKSGTQEPLTGRYLACDLELVS